MNTMGSIYPNAKQLSPWMFPDPLRFAIMHQRRHCILNKELVPPKSINRFTLFPHLPPELRIKIWQTIASTRKYVELGCIATLEKPSGSWFSHSPPPILLSICQESRAFALFYYSTLNFSKIQIGIPCPTQIYINFDSEALWLCGDLHEKWAVDLLSKNHLLLEHLKYLALDSWLWEQLKETDSGMTVSDDYCHFWPGRGIISKLASLEDVSFHS